MPGPARPRRRRTGLVVGIVVAAVAVLACLGGAAVVAVRVLGGGNDAATANPGAAPPPSASIPARTDQFGVPPKACPLLGRSALKSIYPGARGTEHDMDVEVDDSYNRRCEWSDNGKGDFGVRFLRVDIGVLTGRGAVDTIKGTYPTFVSGLARASAITKVEGKKTLSGYGDEAHLVYGIDTEGCRDAVILARVQNATVEVGYGGCNAGDDAFDLSPISARTARNGLYTAAQSILTRFIAS